MEIMSSFCHSYQRILITMPDKKDSRKHTTYLGLVNSGSSGSLINNDIMQFTNFDMTMQQEQTIWDIATGILLTDDLVTITNYCLAQFTGKRHVTSSFHMFKNCP